MDHGRAPLARAAAREGRVTHPGAKYGTGGAREIAGPARPAERAALRSLAQFV